jgi:hypothetical protein
MKALQFFETMGTADPPTQHKSQKTEIF